MLHINAIELTNLCNLRCPHCPNSVATYPKGYVTLEHFSKALNYTDRVVGLSLCGESLLHPRIYELIKVAKQFNREVGIHTNGTFLTKDICNKLIETKIDNIEISIHTEKSLLGYKKLFEANEAAGRVLKTLVGNVLTCYESELRSWIKNAQLEKKHFREPPTTTDPINFGLRFAPMHNWALDPPNPQNNRKSSCYFIMFNLCVMKWDGKIHSCCFDFNGTNYIGEIDNFPNLQHKADYKLCESCSPSWITESKHWHYIDESYLQ